MNNLFYTRWFNKGAGLELEPDKNSNIQKYTAENCTLFYAEYAILYDILNEFDADDRDICDALLTRIEVKGKSGRYHRDFDSAIKYNENKTDINPISKDNLLGIVWLCLLFNLDERLSDIRSQFWKSLGTYNNTRKIRFPFNPGFYATFGALIGGFTGNLLSIICFPFFVINFYITHFKNKNRTSSRLLYFFSLYLLRNHWIYGKFWKINTNKLKQKYDYDFPFNDLVEIYFKHPDHPIRNISKVLKEILCWKF